MARIAQLRKPAGGADEITWTNSTGSSVTVGTPQVVEEAGSNLKGIALIPEVTVANGSTGTALVKGEIRVNKTAAGVALAAGQTVYYDVSASVATNVTTATTDGDFVLGYATQAATQASNEVRVMLNEGPDAYTVIS